MNIPESAKGVLSPGDIAKGMYVTVYEWIEDEPPVKSFSDENPAMEMMLAMKKVNGPIKTGCGVLYKVMAIQLPYVVVEIPAPKIDSKEGFTAFNQPTQKVVMDTRMIRLMELNNEMVKALTPVAVKTPKIDLSALLDVIQPNNNKTKPDDLK